MSAPQNLPPLTTEHFKFELNLYYSVELDFLVLRIVYSAQQLQFIILLHIKITIPSHPGYHTQNK